MINSFDNLTGSNLEEWFKNLFIQGFGLEKYVPSNGQIRLSIIEPSQSAGENLEIDGLLLINRTCIVLEFTNQNSNFKEKVKKFIRNINLFKNLGTLTLSERFELFGVPEDMLLDFEDIENWKYAFFCTAPQFESENLKRLNFPEYPDIQSQLYLFGYSQIEYLRQMSNLVNKFSKNDFLATLDFSALDLGDEDESFYVEFIKSSNKFITSSVGQTADIYLIKLKVNTLLRVARVSRYEGLPFTFDSEDSQYQRLLIESKLKNISNKFINNNPRNFFPNTITLVLNSECVEEDIDGIMKIKIPKKYGSIDIIDGQHRLFSYTNSSVSDLTREKAELFATAIKFRTEDSSIITKNSAKVFCEINSNQAKVKNNLIYLIKYDVLGERDSLALAGKVILELNKKPHSKPLGDIFLTNALKKKNKFNQPPIPVTTIIENDLAPFIRGLNTNGFEISDTLFTQVFGHSKEHMKSNPNTHLSILKTQIEWFFSKIKSVFNNDWKINSESYLLSAKYISSLIRLYRYYKFELSLTETQITQKLEAIKVAVNLITMPSASECSFKKNNPNIPSTKHGLNTIYNFLKDTTSFP